MTKSSFRKILSNLSNVGVELLPCEKLFVEIFSIGETALWTVRGKVIKENPCIWVSALLNSNTEREQSELKEHNATAWSVGWKATAMTGWIVAVGKVVTATRSARSKSNQWTEPSSLPDITKPPHGLIQLVSLILPMKGSIYWYAGVVFGMTVTIYLGL